MGNRQWHTTGMTWTVAAHSLALGTRPVPVEATTPVPSPVARASPEGPLGICVPPRALVGAGVPMAGGALGCLGLSCRPVHFVGYADATIPRALPGGGWRTALARPTRQVSSRPSSPIWTDWSFVSTFPISGTSTGFGELGVPQALAAALGRRGITAPFPIQAATLPDSLVGRDVCGMAPTGSGKTLAFGLAILTRLGAGKRGHRHPSALVLVPTRELAAQIEAEIAPLAAAVDARVASIYGGVGYGKQLGALQRGVDVLIACPGRLADLVERRCVDLSLVGVVVVDEADRMADMGFLPAVRRLIDMTSASRQTLLFSATLEGPVEKLVKDYQHNPVRHDVQPARADEGHVQHHFWRVEAEDRVAVTAEAITARGPAIVFCRTRRGADRLSDRLARSGLQAEAIHGDRSQVQRDRALAAFRSGRLDVLVATDVASRGIHVDAVPLVVHFDPPADPTDYVHRAGRTGRAGADGTVVSLVGHEHVVKTKLMQKKLGLSNGISSPDVPSLASIGPAREPRALQSRPERKDPAAERFAPRADRAKKPGAPGRPSRGGAERIAPTGASPKKPGGARRIRAGAAQARSSGQRRRQDVRR